MAGPQTTIAMEAIEERFRALLDRVLGTDADRDMVRTAYTLSSRMHTGQIRKSGEPYIAHPLEVAHLLADLRMDAASIAAGIMHDLLEDTDLTIAELKETFPEDVVNIVEGVTKISKVHFDHSREAQGENLRKLLLAMALDVRVIIVKLCDRLHNMRTLEALRPDRRRAIARETIDVYAPLANRLGIVRIKIELEDLCMRHLYPEDYDSLKELVAMKKVERERHIAEARDFLKEYLAEHGFPNVEVTGRSKHFFSIYRKMQAQDSSFDQIYDLNALRVIVDVEDEKKGESDCYGIMGLIHAAWRPIDGRFKDYIGAPKANGYRSIHTTVHGRGGVRTEIQIRTRAMHDVAENGIAAHWAYKEGRKNLEKDGRLKWLRQMTEWITDAGDPRSFLDGLKKDVFADIVLCFTPRGDVHELPAGATPVDFAYAIHTEVGNKCVGAKVNNRIASLNTQLAHADIVEILTSEQGHPSRDWLDVAVTNRARSKIKHWLKSKEADRYVAEGRASLERLLAERNIDVTKAELDQALERLLQPYRMKTVEDVLSEIGFGSISTTAALTRMNPEWGNKRRKLRQSFPIIQEDGTEEPVAPKRRRSPQLGPVLIDGQDSIEVNFAKCCAPLPGMPIVGFSTNRGMIVHHAKCQHVEPMLADDEQRKKFRDARWNNSAPINHTVKLRVESYDRGGLLSDVTGEMKKRNLFILQCHTRSNKEDGTAVLEFEVDIADVAQLNDVLASLRRVRNVVSAQYMPGPIEENRSI
ncbi:MAG: bifunctional (p)ppGpp synthetase/guanosine-3',5'-bis(diphosphate) 3'-pyrophosphohydrolase [Sumerlaeia bacterium]